MHCVWMELLDGRYCQPTVYSRICVAINVHNTAWCCIADIAIFIRP
jgi:hypothetical protein